MESPFYKVHSTSNKTADVEDIWVDPPQDKDAALTRRILRATIVDNVHSDAARVKACLMHQRRHSKKEPWKDVDSFNLNHLKAGEEVRLQLGATETYHLHRELTRLHEIASEGVPRGERHLVIAPVEEAIIVQGPVRGVIEKLLGNDPDEVIKAISEIQPDLLRVSGLMKLHQQRESAVEEFQHHLIADDWDESRWQAFFEANTWIFGYGLNYRFLSTIQAQPNYGGETLSGSGGQRGDFLTSSEADVRFTVLVEIKRPSSLLVGDSLYRNKVHLLGGEVVGGVGQLQSNCRIWEQYGACQEENRESLAELGVHTIQPKGILIVGNTSQLGSVTKRTTFELFRRNLINPEIITFDELLARAKHLVLNDEKQQRK